MGWRLVQVAEVERADSDEVAAAVVSLKTKLVVVMVLLAWLMTLTWQVRSLPLLHCPA